ncbi:phosphatidylserine/phosphatidylglycerophosphate/cardiolipin synthase family protein [Erythrobacter insulae]|uniref:Phospholipase D n=1 Tax=Erythrobacter insulae TaxID=2584124 RepID=A0A547PC27_9SPHN|nr:phosphatidylserine/phosphatidylglycerophosphate/cardiolipin synthase family protein [Erythrobacter insulae]TRD11687.1 phosphatidylserine/phosphatidylglycerophosphate/cardiolipin synthase family protein [Erythrobacter insulae]
MTQKRPLDPAQTPTSNYEDAESFQFSVQDHAFTFYPRGSDRLAALIDHIEKARHTLAIFYYMFQHDKSGTQIRDALVEAANRGVDVRLIIDAFGSDAPDHFFDPIVEAGGQFNTFSAKWSVRYLIRNHQKFVIADNARVLTGGSNISDHYFETPSNNGWCDLGIAIEGPVVERFTNWFELLRDWVQSDSSQLRRMRSMVKDWDGGDGPVRLLVGGPLVRKSHWAWQFKSDLIGAKRLDTVSAYFSPPRSMRRLMTRIARRGEMRMVMAGKSDIRATIDVARLLYKNLLHAGAHIFEFQPCKLHMKLMIADGVSYFGSANLDKRSARINVELMVRVEDDALAERLREFVTHLEGASMRVTPKWYTQEASFWNRMRWRFEYWIALADYRMARGLNN